MAASPNPVNHMAFASVCRALALGAAAFIMISSCATRGRVDRRYDASVYSGAQVYPLEARDENPLFIAYGDTQSGWRANEKFLRRENWITAKAFIFPFFQVYTIVQGAIGGVNYIRQHPDYGGVERRRVRDAAYARAREEQVDFILNLGDVCANDGRRPSHWKLFYDENMRDVPLAREFPYVTTPGNHDRFNDAEDGAPNYNSTFAYPRFYTLAFPDIAIFVIDSNVMLDQYDEVPDEEQDRQFGRWIVSANSQEPSWLQKELARHTQEFKVVAMHHPPACIGRHYDDWDRKDWGENLPEKRRQFLDLLIDAGVDLVLCGHEHNYQHLELRRDGRANALDVVVSSGGGAPIRAFADDEETAARRAGLREGGVDVRVVARAEVHHYTVVEVVRDTLTVSTYAVAEGDGDGNKIETIVLTGDGR